MFDKKYLESLPCVEASEFLQSIEKIIYAIDEKFGRSTYAGMKLLLDKKYNKNILTLMTAGDPRCGIKEIPISSGTKGIDCFLKHSKLKSLVYALKQIDNLYMQKVYFDVQKSSVICFCDNVAFNMKDKADWNMREAIVNMFNKNVLSFNVSATQILNFLEVLKKSKEKIIHKDNLNKGMEWKYKNGYCNFDVDMKKEIITIIPSPLHGEKEVNFSINKISDKLKHGNINLLIRTVYLEDAVKAINKNSASMKVQIICRNKREGFYTFLFMPLDIRDLEYHGIASARL